MEDNNKAGIHNEGALDVQNAGLYNHWFNIEEMDEFYDSDSGSSSDTGDEKEAYNSVEDRIKYLNRCYAQYFAK